MLSVTSGQAVTTMRSAPSGRSPSPRRRAGPPRAARQTYRVADDLVEVPGRVAPEPGLRRGCVAITPAGVKTLRRLTKRDNLFHQE